jgi:excisionase family DNA binding protein
MALTLERQYLTVAEAAALWRVSAPTVYRRVAAGDVPHIRIGTDGPIRIPASAILEDRILREKTEFVERHRKRLISDAAKVRSRAVKNLQDAITVVEQAREEATTALQTERWAREFPGELANPSTLSVDFLKGGRLSKAMPEVRTLTVATSVLEWLRDDAAWINSALAYAAERPLDPHEQSVWGEAPEGREAIALANKRVRLGLEPRAVRQAEWFD